jgi:hypothetical protein
LASTISRLAPPAQHIAESLWLSVTVLLDTRGEAELRRYLFATHYGKAEPYRDVLRQSRSYRKGNGNIH